MNNYNSKEQMRTNKLRQSLSCYHSCRPNESPQNQSPKTARYRCLPKKPAIFSIQAHHKHKTTDLYNYLQRQQTGVFSLEKINMEKIKEQRQFLEKAKLPSFNIKKMFDRNINHWRSSHEKDRRTDKRQSNLLSCDSASREFGRTQYDLKQFWNKYLHSEQLSPSQGNDIELLNKNMGLVINRNKQNKSQALSKTFYQRNTQKIEFNPEKARQRSRLIDARDRTTFFVNNFIKTRHKKRANPTPEQPRGFDKVVGRKVVHTKREETFEKNCIMPWQKIHDTEEDNFMG